MLDLYSKEINVIVWSRLQCESLNLKKVYLFHHFKKFEVGSKFDEKWIYLFMILTGEKIYFEQSWWEKFLKYLWAFIHQP